MTATTLQRLLKAHHSAVFDKSPLPELALRLRHPSGAAWGIADGVLTASAAGADYSYDLDAHTVSSLSSALQADGFEVAYVSPNFASHGASVLVEGQGDQYQSNGDHLNAFTSPLWAILSAYGGELRHAKYESDQALRQMVIPQSEGEWLDLWGTLYGVERQEGEDDPDYAPRIPEEAFRQRVNALAIEKAINDQTGFDVEIREPWKRMFSLDISSLSGDHHFQDERYYSYFVIHPVARSAADWSQVFPIVERNRAAGIEVYPPALEFSTRHISVAAEEYVASMGSSQTIGVSAWPIGDAVLGVMRLDDNEFAFNHPVMAYSLRGMSNVDGLAMGGESGDLLDQNFVLDQSVTKAAPKKIVFPRDIAYASICLSDGVALGDENAILGRSITTYDAIPPSTLSSELAPSDYSIVKREEIVERIMLQVNVSAAQYPSDQVQAGADMASIPTFRAGVIRDGSDTIIMGMTRTDQPAGAILNDTLILNISKIQ